MADNDSAVGAILEIPAGALRNIEKAEKAIWALHDASVKTANQVYGDFSKRMPMGVDVLIKKLAEAKKAMEDVGTVNVNLNVKGASAEMDSFAGKMKSDTEGISRAIQDLALAKVDFSKVKEEAESTGMKFEAVEERIKNLKDGLKVQVVGSTAGQATTNEIRAWEELLRIMKLADEERNKALNNIQKKQQNKTDKTYLDEQKRLLDRILQLRKDIADVNISVKRGQIVGKDVSNEVVQLEKLRQELVSTGTEYRKLREGKGDISNAAQTKAEVATQKFYTESLKETLRERNKLNEAITRGNELTAQGQQGKTRLGSGEEAAIQRQLNSDYKSMLKIIKEQGELKAKVASEGRRMTQDEINLIAALAQRYKVYYDDVNRIAGAYKNMSAAAANNFQADKSEQLARNAILLADAQAKAAPTKATQDRKQAESDLNRLYTERLRLLKEKEQLENKGLISSLTAKESQLLNEVTNKLASVDREIQTIGNSYRGLAIKTRHAFALDELRQATQLQNQFNKAVDALDADRAKKLTAEYKRLYAENEKIIKSLDAANKLPAGSMTPQAYQTYNNLWNEQTAIIARMAQIERQNIQEVSNFRAQKEMEDNRRSISDFIQAENQKKEIAIASAKTSAQQYAQSYAGAMKQFENMMTGNASGKLAINLENVKRVLNDLQTAAGKLDITDPADVVKARKLKDAIQELKRIVEQYKDVTNVKPDKPIVSKDDAINAAKNASTLKSLQAAYMQLKTVMDETDPDSDEWKEMNAVYSDTKERIDAIRTSMGGLQTQSQRTNGMMGQLQNRIAAAFSVQAITGFIKEIVKTRAEFELQNVALRAILQNKDEADKIFNQVQQMAMQSPFTIMQLNTYTKQLAAYRVESEKLLGTTKMLADVSAGLGVEMDRLILAYGQVKSANYLRATEVRQFTEAGLNIGGELAQYFSELKGEMVTVGDVMEMITKRMVRFEDVEEVFKRITGAGGLFYDMQKKQSETLMGQMQRIKDVTAIMMNEIGTSNQGAISAVLKMIRGLIQNWKVVVNLLYGAGAAMGAYAIKTTAAAIAQGAFNASSKGLVGVLAKVKDSLKDMLESLKANPYTLLIGAAVVAGKALYDLVQKTNEVKASYDNMIVGLSESSSKLNEITGRIEKAQDEIESTKKKMSGLKVGTDEYSAAAEANKEAVTEQYRALQELRNKFPEVYAKITRTAEGTKGLTEAVREFNSSTQGAYVILTRIKDRESIWSDGFKEDFEDLSEAQTKYDAALAEENANLNAFLAKAEASYNTRKAEGTLTKEQTETYKKLLAIRESTLHTEEKIKAAWILNKNFDSDLKKEWNDFFGSSDRGKALLGLYNSMKEAELEADKLMNDILIAAGVTSAKMFKDLPPETQKSAKEAGELTIKELGLALDEVQRKVISHKIEIPLGIRFDFGGNNTGELNSIQKKINEYIKKHPKVNIDTITSPETDVNQIFANVAAGRKANLADARRYSKATVRYSDEQTNAQLANAEKVTAAARQAMEAYFGFEEEENEVSRGSRGSGRDAILELWKNRLKAVQDFYKRYEELRENYSDTESLKRAQDAFAKLFKTLKIDMSEVVGRGMEKKGLADNIKAMLEQVRKVRPQLADEFEKAFADVTVQIDVEIQKEALDKIKNDMQEVADNYELTETFRKMGVTTDLVFMLGGKPTTLKDYRKTLEDTYKQPYLIEEQYGKEGVKAYEEVLKKIEQLEQKNAIERAKNYVKYLTESVGERAQIEIKAMREIEAIRSDDTLDDFSKEQAVLQRRKKMMGDLAKVDMENLKSSDVYVSVFKDLENASKEQLQFVINKLRELQSTFKDLSPAQVRSLANDMKKLENAVADKESFKKLGSTLKEVIAFQRNRNDLLRQQAVLQEQVHDAQANESATQIALTDAQIKLNSIQDKSSKEYKEQEKIVRDLQMRLLVIQSVVGKTGKDLKEITDDINDGDEATKRLEKTWEKIAKILNSTSSFIGDISEGLSNMGLLTDGLADGFESAQSVISSALQTGAGVVQAFTSKDPIGKLQGAFQALGGVVKLVGSLIAIGDKKKERQIKKLQEKVEDLDKAYENLHDAMEEAYQFDDYNAGYEASMKNLDEQAKAYDEIIRLEEAKKKTDKNKVKEYKEAREEIEKAREELREARYEEYGSISKKSYQDEAEAFVSAWLDAYKETGDGLDALTEHWDEFFENLVMKQAASSIVSKRMAKYIDMINAAIDSGDTGLSLAQKFKTIGESLKSELGEWDAGLEAFFEGLGFKGGSGSLILSDLQKGIQNITEPQAAAIEAYLNSMRSAVFRHTEQLDTLIAAIQMQYGNGDGNPVVIELKAINRVLDNIYSTLRSVVATGVGKAYIQVG